MKYGNFFVRLRDFASYASASERARAGQAYAQSLLTIAERDLTTADIDMAGHGVSGNFEPLARHIEAGGNLGPESRRTLVRILRSELRFSRGARRTYAQALADMRVTEEVRGFQRHFAIRHGWRGSRASAIRRYLELHPEMNEETLKDYLKRDGGTLSKEEQSMINDARREVAGDVTKQISASNGVRK